MTLHEEIRAALANKNVQAFLRSPIREGESSQDTTAYWWLYGSTKAAPKLADSLGDHPRVKTYETYDGQFIKNGKLDFTTAAGAYQITATTWDTVVQPALHLPDFTPESQDMAAVYLLKHRRALDDVMAGRFGAACGKLQQEWASMPGASFGDQPTQQMARVLALYKQYGGALEPQGATNAPAPAPTPQPAPAAPPGASIPAGDAGDAPENSMPPFIAAGLSALIQHAPALIRVFGDSPQAEKNAKAAEVVAGIAQQVTGQPTVEGAIQVLDTNPTTAAAYREAVHQSMPELLGLLVQATEVDEKTRATALDRNLQLGQATGGRWLWLLGAVVILVLVMSYAITVGVLFLPRSPEQGGFSLDTKALLIGQIVILGFATVLAWLFGSNIANRLSQQANLTKDKP